jgi:hypothetical protein
MTYTEWLRRQVVALEAEIRSNPVFEANSPASPEDLRELRQTIVLHTYLKQQLLRRERVGTVPDEVEMDAQEFVLVPVPIAAYRPR